MTLTFKAAALSILLTTTILFPVATYANGTATLNVESDNNGGKIAVDIVDVDSKQDIQNIIDTVQYQDFALCFNKQHGLTDVAIEWQVQYNGLSWENIGESGNITCYLVYTPTDNIK